MMQAADVRPVRIEEAAPAKINLALHVTGQRDDGYHLLDSLVTFCRHGDRLSFAPSDADEFHLSGRFGPQLAGDGAGNGNNLVTRARDLLRQVLAAEGVAAPPVAITLQKDLPIASGIGGGSADAAATLRGLSRLWQAQLSDETLQRIALALGADVPMCLQSRPLRATGIGETLTPLPHMPELALVLGNPLEAVSTPAIFRLLTSKTNASMAEMPTGGDPADWIAVLKTLRNDLEPPARALLAEIDTICMLLAREGALLTRMSGSGATCFGLFADKDHAEQAAASLCRQRPDWYFQASQTFSGGDA
jgi:4-diphosphocytidyl-2-C-methyl-D-erythritol kinase